jgi:hypothetical protein
MILFGCQSEYEKVVEEGLKSGEIHEDLIFDMSMGQTQKEFYSICWELNKEKKISQGSGNRFAKYVIPPGELFEEPEEVEMLFYGVFDEDKIMRGMEMRFTYVKWSPWNEDFHSDKLIERLKRHYMNLYGGNEFMSFDIGMENHDSFVKIDGNRQILIYQLSNKDISVKIEDLRYKFQKQSKK